MTNNKIKPLTIEIDAKLWENFKNKIPRTITLNDAIVGLITKEINNDK